MSRNIIFFFSGTGNSLHIAKRISEHLDNCELFSMKTQQPMTHDYERIGFVFPHYALGVPNIVRRFMEEIDLSAYKNAYFFAIETMGGFRGNCLAQVRDILKSKGITLSYGNAVLMFANNVVNYDMKKDAVERTADSNKSAMLIASDIQQKKQNSIRRTNFFLALIYKSIVSSYPQKGLDFNVSNTCMACGQCIKICPTENITINSGKPVFGNQCEQCMACIQWCPKTAINYKNKTQTRGRYHHPDIDVRDMIVK